MSLTYLTDSTLLFGTTPHTCFETIDLQSLGDSEVIYIGKNDFNAAVYSGHRTSEVCTHDPRAVTYDGDKIIYVINAVGLFFIDTSTDLASPLINNLHGAGKGMLFDSALNCLIVSINDGLLKVNLSDATQKLITGQIGITGDSTGTLLSSKFNNPIGVAKLDDSVYLVSDENNHR